MDVSLRDGTGRRAIAFKEFELSDGITIGVFQGSRGGNPDLDIIIKYQQLGRNVRTPKHTHWTIDLLIKRSHNRDLTKEFVRYLLEMWDVVQPFETKEEQQECVLRYSNRERLLDYITLNAYGEYSVEFIACVMELLMIQEKTGLATAFMFKGILEAIYNDQDIFSIVSAAGFNGR